MLKNKCALKPCTPARALRYTDKANRFDEDTIRSGIVYLYETNMIEKNPNGF